MLSSALVSLSGGMDSTALLAEVAYILRSRGHHEPRIEAVSFVYGSKHNQYERKAAEDVAAFYGIELHKVDLTPVIEACAIKSNLLKSGDEIPEGYYEGENMRQTVVPGRNTLFISLLLGMAESMGIDSIFVGIHAGDHFIYPDCRPNYFNAMEKAVHEATDGKVGLYAPFLNDNKTSIIKQGLRLGVPFHLTRTCYKDQPIACGKCGSCQERLDAFNNNNDIPDPVEYESRELISKDAKPVEVKTEEHTLFSDEVTAADDAE